MNWNIPYGAMGSSEVKAINHALSLSDIKVTTPPSSPREAPSLIPVTVREIIAINRARLLVQERQMNLLKSIKKPQRI